MAIIFPSPDSSFAQLFLLMGALENLSLIGHILSLKGHTHDSYSLQSSSFKGQAWVQIYNHVSIPLLGGKQEKM